MRKTVVLGLVMMVLSTGMISAEVQFGVKAGVGMSSYTGSDWSDYLSYSGSKNRFGVSYAAGALANYSFDWGGALQLETLFTSITGGETITLGSDEFYSVYRELAVEIPLYFLYGLDAGPGRILFAAGPSLYINIGKVFEKGSNDYKESYSLSDYYNIPVRAGVSAGLGYELEHWQALVLYKRSISPRELVSFGDIGICSHIIALEVGYLF
ncbi:MAG: outer membrane beta-barrel protein [Spirochaetales bacterium]|nr:outer membrane beta-barrel protein [Spirochaetales bacterium]